MEHFVTWQELMQYTSLLLNVLLIAYTIFHNDKK